MESIIKCPICGKNSHSKFKINDEKSNREYFECEFCHFLFQKGKKNINKELYKDNIDWDKDDPGFKKRTEMIKALMEKTIKEKDKKILDYGCGTGLLVSLLRRDGYNIVGFDPYLEEGNQNKGLFNKINDLPSRKFDCLVAVETIEHLKEPQKDIKEILSLIEENGFFVFSTQFYIPGRHKIDWQYIQQPVHLSIFSLKAAEILAKQADIKKRIPFKIEFDSTGEFLTGQIWSKKDTFPFIRWFFDSLNINNILKK